MTRVRGILVAAACLVAALGLAVLAPGDDVIQAPFLRTIPALNVPTDSRELVVTVTAVRLADHVQTPDWTGTTNGVWLVADVQFERRSTGGGISGLLKIGNGTYALSKRAESATLDQGASGEPGLPWAGTILVELPESVVDDPAATHAGLQFAAFASTLDGGELDSVLQYDVDLTALDHVSSVSLMDPHPVSPSGAGS